MGTVYEAVDQESGARVALKTLRRLAADNLLAFKNEFRTLAALDHPNLVRLGDLFEEGGQWFFTMELLEGSDLLTYVRGGEARPPRECITPSTADGVPAVTALIADQPAMASTLAGSSDPQLDEGAPVVRVTGAFDETRLRDALAQLGRGLYALHAAGKVHRDVKPSNTRVTPEGRVVLLDFGLVTDAYGAQETPHAIVGTPRYMAPEQAAARPAGTAADWYAFGVMLYEALTGVAPHQGNPLEIMLDKQRHAPRAPSSVASVPLDLDALCMELLRFEPAERPSGAAVLRRLGVEPTSEQARGVTCTQTPAFLGRQEELATLEQAYAALVAGREPATVLIAGASGVGKSALVREFTERLSAQDPGVVLLRGRCYERESVPYKAFDGCIDELSQRLASLPDAEVAAVVPPGAGLLAQVFPVLRRVRALATDFAPTQVADAQELRKQVFAAFRELLVRMSVRRRVVLAIDDLQWADADSLALLAALLRPPDAPGILVLATTRPTGLDPKRLEGAVRRVELGGLPPEQASELAQVLLVRALDSHPDLAHVSAAIAREAAGHPLFIDELVRHLAVAPRSQVTQASLDDALWQRICWLDAAARQVLYLVAVSGAPTSLQVIARAADLELPALMRQVSLLRVANFVRASGSRTLDLVEPYHDRVREAVLVHLDEVGRRRCHERLALALEASGLAEPQALALHWRGAGHHARAAHHAALGAARAAEALAFEHAASLYALALELREPGSADERELRIALAGALANAGRGRQAAAAYQEAAHGAPRALGLELLRQAAEQLLVSGHVDEGVAVLRDVLDAFDMQLPGSPGGALRSLLWRRLHLRARGTRFARRDPSEVTASDRARVDLCWSAASGLAMTDNIRGADFQTRHLLLALRLGQSDRVARALALEGAFVSTSGPRASRRTRALLDQAQALAQEIQEPNALGLTAAAHCLAAVMEGRWREGVELSGAAEDILRNRCRGVTWQLDCVKIFELWALYHLGDMHRLARRTQERLHEAAERGDRYATTSMRSGWCNAVWLARDDAAGAQRELDVAMQDWSQRGFHVQHTLDYLARAHVDLYRGDLDGLRRREDERWAALRRSMIMRVHIACATLLGLRARTRLLEASQGSARRRVLLREVRADARRLRAQRAPWCDGLAHTLVAGAASLEGSPEAALRELDQAIASFACAEMTLHVAVARLRRGELLGGADGARLRAEAEATLRANGVHDAVAWARMTAPGFATP